MKGPDVCTWHIADVPLTLSNVCFEWENGHDAIAPLCQLLTQNGPARLEPQARFPNRPIKNWPNGLLPSSADH